MARNLNILAIKAGHSISPEVAIFLSEAEQACSIDGSLYAWESGVNSMRGPNCMFDPLEELAIHACLGQLPAGDFYFKRAGDEVGARGQWTDHPFGDFEEMIVIDVERQYRDSTAEPQSIERQVA